MESAWLRNDATKLADGNGNCFAATWQHGLGRVSTIAFPANQTIAETLSRQIEAPPRDPRITVSWETGAELKITVNAVAGQEILNNRPVRLELRDAEAPGGAVEMHPIPQSGPGLYELRMPAPRRPRIAAVSTGPRHYNDLRSPVVMRQNSMRSEMISRHSTNSPAGPAAR